jgi:hypothetical protein
MPVASNPPQSILRVSGRERRSSDGGKLLVKNQVFFLDALPCQALTEVRRGYANGIQLTAQEVHNRSDADYDNK